MDEYYFKLAEEYLYSKLVFEIGRNEKEMKQLITDTIKKKDMNAATMNWCKKRKRCEMI